MSDQTPVVLVVEDEPLVQPILSTACGETAFRTRVARSVAEALQILGTEHIDAITLDTRVPDPDGQQRSGLPLLRFLRSIPAYETLPVLISAGMSLSATDQARARQHRADVFYKPQAAAVLVAAVNRMLTSGRPATLARPG